MKEPKNLTSKEAVDFLRREHDRMAALPDEFDDSQLTIDAAILMGYKMAIADFEACTMKKGK